MLGSPRLFFWLLPLSLLAQKPAVYPDGVVNAATLTPVSMMGHALAPGGIGSIFGQNLASTSASAAGFPLPNTLAGTSVTVNGVPAPLFYVSPGQINFQVPSSTNPGTYMPLSPAFNAYGHASIIVTTAAGASDTAMADTFVTSPGIFTVDGSGCGQAAALNVKPDGTISVNSPSNSASPGDYLAIYGTGLGAVSNSPPDGTPGPVDPLARAEFLVSSLGRTATFGGRAPGLVGVDQINILVPADVREGCAVPLQIFESAGLSQSTLVSIHSGGGQCIDPPTDSAGEIVLKKSVVLNDTSIPESDTFTASFSAAPGKRLAFPPVVQAGTQTIFQSGSCPLAGFATLNAGTITLIGPRNLTMPVQPAVTRGATGYQAELGSGVVQSGTFQLSAQGGPDIGPFQATLNVGSGVQVTSQIPRGMSFSLFRPLTVTWTGGQPGETVTLRVIEHQFLYDHVEFTQGSATSGTLSLDGIGVGDTFRLPLEISPNVEIVIEVGPDPSQPQIISAPGLTLGSVIIWKYEYRFVGLSMQ